MILSNLLDVSEEATQIVTYVSIGAVVVLLLVLAALCFSNKKFSAKDISFAAICVAASFVLSFAKVSPVTYGGSITLASFVPLLIYTYYFGLTKGFLTGLIFGLLNFISGPYILTPMTFVLDYLLAFASIGLMGLVRILPVKSVVGKVAIGTSLVYFSRFVWHLISGFIYFAQGAIWVDSPMIPTSNAFIYSLCYQLVYLVPDFLIALVVMIILAKTGVLERLQKIAQK